jgi:hypothetical protein
MIKKCNFFSKQRTLLGFKFEAFGKLKEKLTHAPILCHPDFSNTFILDTDASNKAIGFPNFLQSHIGDMECG